MNIDGLGTNLDPTIDEVSMRYVDCSDIHLMVIAFVVEHVMAPCGQRALVVLYGGICYNAIDGNSHAHPQSLLYVL